MKNEKLVISFGDVFEVTDTSPKVKRHVIVDLGERGWFGSAGIIEEDPVKLGIPGTSGKEDISRMTGERWTIEKIEEGLMNVFKTDIPTDVHAALLKESSRDVRVLS